MRIRVIGVLVAAVLMAATVAGADNTFQGFQIVKVVVNQQEVVSDVPAVNFHGRTMLPVRKIAELAGLTVDRWDAETNTVYLSGGGDLAQLQAENAKLKAELAQLKAAGVGGQAVATVNGEAISRAEVYDRMIGEIGAKVVDDLITETLVNQAARQANITVMPSEIGQAINKIKERVGGEEKFQLALQQNNITLDQLRANQLIRLKIAKLLTPTIPVNDELLQRYFEANRAQFDKRTVRARHILLATEAEAKEIKAQLDKGADFATLARTKSTDPSAKTNAGDLGTFGPGRMVPEFDRVVFSLQKGAISEPFLSPFGWHIAQVLEVSGTAPAFEAIKADVQAAYLEEKVQERVQPWLAELRAKAEITNSLKLQQ